MSSKTKKNRNTKPKNTTRKTWKKPDRTQAAFQINSKYILDKNNDKRVRIERLKTDKYEPEQKKGEIRRAIPKRKDNWKPEDIIKFKYLVKKYKWSTNYK